MTTEFSGSIVALVTPLTSSGKVDSNAYMRLLERHLEQGTHGLVVGGTTGESATLSADELEMLVRTAKRECAGRIPVIAGAGTNSTAGSIDLTLRMAGAGADGCLIVTPYYNKPTQDGLRRHYEAIADQSPVPLIMYNVPARTGCDLLPGTIGKLAGHPRIVAVKEATGQVGRAREILDCANRIDVLSGDDATALSLLRAGACGVVSVTANVAPGAMAEMCAAAAAGDYALAATLDERLQPLHRALFVEPNPIPVKYALHRMGLIADVARLPLTPLSEAHRATVEQAMQFAELEVA